VGLIVDTSEFVRVERKGGLPIDVIARYGSGEDYAVSVVTIAELQHGIRRADGPRRRALRERFLADVLSLFNIFPMDLAIALRVGDIDADLKSQGQGLPLPDIIIASTALELGYAVATFNLKDFKRIPGLQIAEPKARK
jgi:predicted nucleic acid-binding protein